MSGPQVKICGVKDLNAALAAARSGADYLGFVFFRKSPRFILPEKAEEVILDLKEASFEEGFALPKLVGLFVDAGEKELSEAPTLLTHFQFHGHESPERCKELGDEFAVEIIKALPVSVADDVLKATEFEGATDIILFDAKPPPGAGRPGGHGVSFDWTAISSYTGETPFMLAGGLSPDNVADAVASQKDHAGFLGVDVSSGVETAPGTKSADLITSFVSAAKGSK